MNKRLVAKTQKILPKIPQYAGLFSNIITSTPEDEEVLKKKGTVYGVFEVSGPIEFETAVISKTISDILQDSYFRSENISPVQSLEKAISDTKEKLTKLNENTLRAKNTDLKLDIVAAVLWGNVLYVVQHGEGSAFIMREGEAKPVSFLAEGNFSSASGIVKNDDVIIISTVSFEKKFPPNALLRAGTETFSDLPPESSCLMIKFSIDSTFTKEEQIDFGVKARKPVGFDLSAIMEKIKPKAAVRKEAAEEVMSIRGAGTKISLKGIRKLLIPLFLAAFAISIVFTIKGGFNKTAPKEKEEAKNTDVAATDTPTEQDDSFFYDISFTDGTAVPTDILITKNKVLVSDKATGKLYVSDIVTPQFSALETQFLGASDFVLKEGLVNFKDEEGYKVYNLETNTVEEDIKLENLGTAYPYLDFIYELSGDLLSKYTKAGERSDWAQTPDFSGGASMAIDVSIYILKNTGEVLEYNSGAKVEFELKGMDMGLNNPIKMVAPSESEHLYIADAGNQSVVITDREGNFEQRIYHKNKEKWGDIKSIAISPEEDKLYVLNGTTVYEVSL